MKASCATGWKIHAGLILVRLYLWQIAASRWKNPGGIGDIDTDFEKGEENSSVHETSDYS